MNQDQAKRINGGAESQRFVGVGPHNIANGLRGYALVVNVTGTIIAAMLAQSEGGDPAHAYVPTGWLGVALSAGEYHVSAEGITQITLTAAADSVTVYCDRTF